MRFWHRRKYWWYFKPFGPPFMCGGFGFRNDPWSYRMTKEEEREYLQELKRELEEELEEINKRLEELK